MDRLKIVGAAFGGLFTGLLAVVVVPVLIAAALWLLLTPYIYIFKITSLLFAGASIRAVAMLSASTYALLWIMFNRLLTTIKRGSSK